MAPERITSHIVETRSRDNVRSLIDRDGTALLRDLTERDYGIDAIMELFDKGNVTGKFALLQLKGKEHKIIPLKKVRRFHVKSQHQMQAMPFSRTYQ